MADPVYPHPPLPGRGWRWWILITLWCAIAILLISSLRSVRSLRYYTRHWGAGLASVNGAAVISFYHYPHPYNANLGFYANSNAPFTYEYYTWDFGLFTHDAWQLDRGMDGKFVRDYTLVFSWFYLWIPLGAIILLHEYDLTKRRRLSVHEGGGTS